MCVSGARFVDVYGSYLSKHTSKHTYLGCVFGGGGGVIDMCGVCGRC